MTGLNPSTHGEGGEEAHRVIPTVAQSCTLPYRGFGIRQPRPARRVSPQPVSGRMQFGDTAERNSALRWE
jgi:hypothetical protein